MTELINRQKIARRQSHNSGLTGNKSLISAADKFRNSRNKKKVYIFTNLKKGLDKKTKNRIVHRPKHGVSKKARLAVQKVQKRINATEGLRRFLSIIKKHLPVFSTRILLSVIAVLALGSLSAFFINSYIDKMTMFNGFSLYKDIDINDVLYESLPSDYNGQGSGEMTGIEPVLLTSGEPMNYTVETGDTLSEIARNNNIKIGTLISFNKISDVRRLQVGMEMKIPEFDGVPYEVKSGDTISTISKKHNISINSILDANNLDSDVLQPGDHLFIPGVAMNEFDYKKAMGTLFIYPTNGRLSSGYGFRSDPFTGKRRYHNGVDLANAAGTRISTTMSGMVADVGNRPSGYGKYVIIKHANGYQSLYGHLSRITVREGQYLSQGEKIGEMGNTGRSTGPHLHFSIYKNNIPVNPLTYLW